MALAFGLMLHSATFAQDDENELIFVVGEVSFDEEGNILVDGYIIAPSSAFIPAELSEGDFVLITGYLLPDGLTVQALSLEFVDPEDYLDDEEPTEEPTPEPTEEPTPVPTEEPTPAPTEEPTFDDTRGYYCRTPDDQHPAGARLAEEFDVDYAEIMTLFCDEGFGFGEIMIAYLTAEASEQDVASILALRAEGMGWGQIMREAELDPREVARGRGRGRGPWGDGERPGGGPPEGRGNGGPPEGRGNGGPPEGRGNGNGRGNR